MICMECLCVISNAPMQNDLVHTVDDSGETDGLLDLFRLKSDTEIIFVKR